MIAAHHIQAPCVYVTQGDFVVTDDTALVFGAILGSCVAACLFDTTAGVGGMNHFLLPGEREGDPAAGERNSVHLMELLVNGLMTMGARRDRLEAKLFGGANVLRGLSNIGDRNAAFAEQFILREGISLREGSLGGARARRIRFWPVSGRARQSFIRPDLLPPPVRRAPAALHVDPHAGEVELF